MAKAAFSCVITAVPAEPENPLIKAIIGEHVRSIISVMKHSDLFERRRELYTRIDGCPLKVQLEIVSREILKYGL